MKRSANCKGAAVVVHLQPEVAAILKSLMQPVFLIAVACVLALVIAGAAVPVAFRAWANAGLHWTTTHFSWFYLASVFGFVVVLVHLAFSKYGDIRLGGPEYSSFSWIAMLLAAGFGRWAGILRQNRAGDP